MVNAIIMAAGMGTRLKPITDTTPKPLVKVLGVPMIENIIENLKARNIQDITIVVGYLADARYFNTLTRCPRTRTIFRYKIECIIAPFSSYSIFSC